MNDEVLKLLGLMYRASKLTFGESVADNMDKMYYVFVASDASEKTIERYKKKTFFYNVTLDLNYSSEQLDNAIGKDKVKVIGVNDKGFYNTLLKKLK